MTLPPLLSIPVAPQRPDAPRPMFSSLAIASSGLSAQRARLDVIAQNLANAETTRTPEGGPYKRRVVELEAIEPLDGTVPTPMIPTPPAIPLPDSWTTPSARANALRADPVAAATQSESEAASHALSSATGVSSDPSADMIDETGGVRVASIGVDTSEGPLVYDPGSPDADKTGYVRMPNVNMTDEMVDLMNARRVYEANSTVFQVARAMLHQAISI